MHDPEHLCVCVCVCNLGSPTHGHIASLSTWVSNSEDSGNPETLQPCFSPNWYTRVFGAIPLHRACGGKVRHPILVSEPRETWVQPWEVCLGETHMFPQALPLLRSVADSVCASWEWEFHQNSAHPGTSVLWWIQKSILLYTSGFAC